MKTATLSVKGQVVIPKDVRQTAQLSVGDEFSVNYIDGEIRLRPLSARKHLALDKVAGCLARPKKTVLSDAVIKARVKKQLKLKYAA